MKNAYIVLTIIFKPEDEIWTAECQELGTATFGDTLEEAKNNIEEAISLHLDTLKDVGERTRFFEEHNIKIHHHRPSRMKIDSPFEPNLLISQNVQQIPCPA